MNDKKVKTYRDLIAWQRAMELARMVYLATQYMPMDERFGLKSQMRRAAVSIPSNIAEGAARQTRPDYLKHLRMARGSMAELSTQMELAVDFQVMEPKAELNDLLDETDRILQGLIMSLERKQREEKEAARRAKQRKKKDKNPGA